MSDATYQAKVHMEGPDKFVVENGGLMEVNGGNQPHKVSLAAAAGGSNVSEITVTVTDNKGVAIAAVFNLDIWLSDDADGQGLTGTSASGAVQAKAASGTDLQVYSAKKAIRVQTLKTGVYTLSITDTGKTAFKVCAQIPGTARPSIITLATGNYG